MGTVQTLHRILRAPLVSATIGLAACICPLLPQQAKALVYSPAYTTTNTSAGSTPTSISSSFGFFFDAASDLKIDGLGFSNQANWGNGTSYIVKLWSYQNGGGSPSDFTVIASQTFTQGQPYTLQNDYFWAPLGSAITLPETSASDPNSLTGYVLAAIGDYSSNAGNALFEGGNSQFDPRIINLGNGFNDASDTLNFYDVPIYDGGIGTGGYFNANLSIAASNAASAVPGPIPLLGAAATFAWSRRLRRRCRARG